MAFFLKSFYFVESETSTLNKFSFQRHYGTIIDGIKVDDWSVFYYPIFLFQRLLYSATLIFLLHCPLLQLFLAALTFSLVLSHNS